MKLPRLAALAAVIVLSISTANIAQASFVIQIYDSSSDTYVILADGMDVGETTDSGRVVTVADSSLTPDGTLTFNDIIGDWTVNAVTAVSEPAIGPGQLHLNTLTVSGGSGTLRVEVFNTDFTGPVLDYQRSYGGTSTGLGVELGFAYCGDNVEFSCVGDDKWQEFGIAPSFSGTAIDEIDTTDAAYALGFEASIIHNAPGQITSFNMHLLPLPAPPAIPIPPAVWLFGSGLLGLIGVARRKACA